MGDVANDVEYLGGHLGKVGHRGSPYRWAGADYA